MRPLRIEVEGFSAFRERAVVDLADVDLFALTGPTGAGKSSLIDAVIFALYGCIPRLDKKAIEPLVSLNAAEARVRLDFTVDGVVHSAVRVVRRRPKGGGATTKEARLERADGEVLAGNERELTEAVGELIGLGVDEFTTCVVLPQGDFARFLHEPGRDRQELLITLLDLGLYERMARVARHREQAASTAVGVAEGLLARFADATPEALDVARDRAAKLDVLQAEVDAAETALEQLRRTEADARAEGREAAARVDRLAQVGAPAGLGSLGDDLAEARLDAERAEAVAEAADGLLAAAQDHRSSQPPVHELHAVVEAHRAAGELREQRSKATTVLDDRRVADDAAAAERDAADRAVVDARSELDRVRWDHRAHDLAATLVVGEACPVCRRTVDELPPGGDRSVGEAIADAEARVQAAERSLRLAGDAARTAGRERIEAESSLRGLDAQLARLAPALDGAPSLADVERRLADAVAADEAERHARDDATAARRAADRCRKALAQVEARVTEARRRFEQVRGELIAFDPPPGGDDLVADWRALVDWAAEQGRRGEVERRRAEVAADQASAEVRAAEQALRERCRGGGVELDPGSTAPTRRPDRRSASAADHVDALLHAGRAVARVAAEAAARVRDLEGQVAEVEAQRTAAAEHRRTAEVAHQLALHLDARHFEKWVLDEVLTSLVERATELLVDLSNGAYSLTLDERSNFAVVDHRNADQVRSARTLSGGETFLASLALALALADQVGELASRGSARLESIFLDEGFGTLDPDTLDTVATAIEELGSRGRMVGLVSHVPELAERVPVRFEVRRGPGGSTVERVDR